MSAAGRRAMRVSLELSKKIDLPIFLCPRLLGLSSPSKSSCWRLWSTPSHRTRNCFSATRALSTSSTLPDAIELRQLTGLPLQCTGCGALSQTTDEKAPGFFSLTRQSVKSYVWGDSISDKDTSRITDSTLEASVPGFQSSSSGPSQSIDSHSSLITDSKAVSPVPVCDRCHNLQHHHRGESIKHPSLASLQDTILDSPHKYNHIYHVIDAADFPMSLVSGLYRLLDITPQRSRNRRATTGRFYHGRKTELSFIITRSDLLAPQKSQVDSLMPRLVTILRAALGAFGGSVRLGNVKCVSAKRDWWTKVLKEEIWTRGGAGWMVGKVNVGKSQLFESVFPKGRSTAEVHSNKANLLLDANGEKRSPEPLLMEELSHRDVLSDKRHDYNADEGNILILDEKSLLPPAPLETNYPNMPLVSSLPGTTASPIRVPFGNGKGELIDLPGLSRGALETYVRPEHWSSLLMRNRIRPEQYVIKPGQSLLLGGFIRITPTTPDLVFLAYPFVPIAAHLTSTQKAIAIQSQEHQTGVENISIPGTNEKITSAGRFSLSWDVTKQRSGPITAKNAGRVGVERLPFRVLSFDLLIEGCGWVEIVAQVRARSLEMSKPLEPETESHSETENGTPKWPEIEVFTPEGRFIGSRQPLDSWLMNRPKVDPQALKKRPRRSMKNAKAMRKSLKFTGSISS